MIYDDIHPSEYDQEYVHVDSLPDFDVVKDCLQQIYDALYKDEGLTTAEGALHYLMDEFRMDVDKYPELKVEKKRNPMTQWYLGYQRAHIDMMNKEKN